MKNLALIAVVASTLVPSLAFADDPQDAPAAPPTPPPAAAQTCRMGDYEGFEEADAHTSERIVCAEIARAGAPAGAHYRVALGKLGSVIILSVAREGDTPGSTADSREMRLQNIEEVMVAAPRIAESIVKGTPLAETEKVDNLVGQDTRQPKSKPGKTHFALGLVGLLPPLDQGMTPAPGIDLDVHYETASQQFEIGGSMRFGGGNGGAAVSNGYFVFSVGGRWYTSDADISPYIGGGLDWSVVSLHLPGAGFDASGNGLGAYVDAGVQILRTNHAHLALGARLDVPFFALNTSQNYSYEAPANGGVGPQPIAAAVPRTYYYAPVSMELRLTF